MSHLNRTRHSILVLSAAVSLLLAVPTLAQPGTAVVERYVDVVGGADEIAAVQSLIVRGAYGFTAPFVSEGAIELHFARPDRLLFRVDLPGYGTILRGYQDGVGWGLDPQRGAYILDGEELQAARRWAARGFSLLPDTEIYARVGDVERVEWEGMPADRVSLVVAGTESEIVEYFDPATGRLVGRTEITGSGEMSGWISEFERHGSLLVPTRWRHKLGAQEWWAKYESVEINTAAPASFEPPAEIQALLASQ